MFVVETNTWQELVREQTKPDIAANQLCLFLFRSSIAFLVHKNVQQAAFSSDMFFVHKNHSGSLSSLLSSPLSIWEYLRYPWVCTKSNENPELFSELSRFFFPASAVYEGPGTCRRHHRASRVVFAGSSPSADRNKEKLNR